MEKWTEYVEFSYAFDDKEGGTEHTVRTCKRKDSITASELCEMFVDFMKAAGYSEENIWDYFSED